MISFKKTAYHKFKYAVMSVCNVFSYSLNESLEIIGPLNFYRGKISFENRSDLENLIIQLSIQLFQNHQQVLISVLCIRFHEHVRIL